MAGVALRTFPPKAVIDVNIEITLGAMDMKRIPPCSTVGAGSRVVVDAGCAANRQDNKSQDQQSRL